MKTIRVTSQKRDINENILTALKRHYKDYYDIEDYRILGNSPFPFIVISILYKNSSGKPIKDVTFSPQKSEGDNLKVIINEEHIYYTKI